MGERSLARTELAAAYWHPFRHTAVQTWRDQPELRRATALALVLLAAIRAHRPQAGTEDPTVGHDEFAVAVEEDGHLVTWRFRPLRVSEQPAESEIEVPGRPRYAASPIEVTAFDVQDTARAGEQLVVSQSQAAEWEAESAAAAQRALEGSHADAELAAEARTTAAVQRATGQTPRRR